MVSTRTAHRNRFYGTAWLRNMREQRSMYIHTYESFYTSAFSFFINKGYKSRILA
jgi:hypothetical protein